MSYTPPQSPTRWQAQWIWLTPRENMDNLHLLARREVTLPARPRVATCWISASSFYELTVNGRRIGRGPNPSLPAWQYFDAYDLGDALTEGVNVLAVRCYNFGPTMDSTLGQDPGPGGLLVQVEADGEVIAATDAGWTVLQDPARKQDTEPISGHRGGFKEVCDGRKAVLGWQKAGFDDGAWPAAHELGPVGTEPWTRLIPREIPPLRVEPTLPRDVFFHTAGQTYGAEVYDVTYPEALRSANDHCATVAPLRDDFAPSVLLDFGQTVYGYLELEFADAPAGGRVEVSYGESLDLTRVDRYLLRGGEQTYRPIERRGGRYVQLTFHDLAGPVQLRRVRFHVQSYDAPDAGHFRCSDEMLNRIWQVGRHTVRMCMQDHYEDCPWREQTLYAGDLAVGALLSYYAFGDGDLAKKSLRQMARLTGENGCMPPLGPAPFDGFLLPEYPAMWIMSLWLYDLHFDDRDLVAELWPTAKAVLGWYDDRLDDDGLFRRRDGETYARFVDNLPNLSAKQRVTAEQILIARGRRCAADLARRLGDDDQARTLESAAGEHAEAIVRLCWDAERRAMTDGLGPDGNTVTQITNGLACLYDILPGDRKPAAVDILRDPTAAPPMRAGYMNFFLVEALAEADFVDEAVARIEEYWGGMVRRGATSFWETFDPESPAGTHPQRLWSQCHEFCSGPVASLPAWVGGLRPLEPGWRRLTVAPRPGRLDWVRATAPTPRGPVAVACMQTRGGEVEMDVLLPPGSEAEVVVPLAWRDVGTVWMDGQAVACGASADELASVCAELQAARRVRSGVALTFAPSAEPRRLTLSTTRERATGHENSLILAAWGDWDTMPEPGAGAPD